MEGGSTASLGLWGTLPPRQPLPCLPSLTVGGFSGSGSRGE